MTHTPGPWTLNPIRSTRVDLIDNPKGEAVGEVVWVDVRNPADAQLICAAPELLAALKVLLPIAASAYGALSKDLDQARDAIARATA